jgi:hypothetical protein
VAGHPKFKTALAEDEAGLAEIVMEVLYSPADQQAVLALEDNAAQSLLDIIQHVRASHHRGLLTDSRTPSADAGQRPTYARRHLEGTPAHRKAGKGV